MQGKTVLITGATSGIGFETALEIAKLGATIVFTTRDITKGENICKQLISLSGNSKVYVMECRLDDFSSIRTFAQNFLSRFTELHVLINNAGVWETSRKESTNSIELTFAVNHLAPFLLTQWMLPLMKNSAPSRIITVSSQAHKSATLNFDDLEFKRRFPWMAPYSQSKLANILFTRLLATKLESSGVTANCLHPGAVRTSIFHNMSPALRMFFKWFMISPAEGAETSIYLATSPEIARISGQYFIRKKTAPISKAAQRDMDAEKLWALSRKYTAEFLPEFSL